MNKAGYALAKIFRNGKRASPNGFGIFPALAAQRRLNSTDKGALVDPKSSTVTADVDIVNYSLAGLFIVGYNQHGFMLSNGATVYGPMVSFPQNAFAWNVCPVHTCYSQFIDYFMF